jgi:hypothetical protein
LAGVAAAPGEEVLLGCCGVFIILPAVVLLILVAWVADAPWAGWTALVVAALTYSAASLLVAEYMPSDDPEVASEQAWGRWLGERFGWLTVAAGGSLGVVGARRAMRCLWPRKLLPKRHLTAAERLAVIEDMASRGLVSAEEAEGLRRRLTSVEAESQDAEPNADT